MFKTLIRSPKEITSSKSPAILMLHGYGSNEADLFSLADYFPDNYYIISARAPFNVQFGGFSWYDIFLDFENNKISDDQQAWDSVLKLSEFTDDLIEKYNLDKDNFNLLGFSQGAILSYALALNYPEKYHKIMALSGYINENIMPVQENVSKFKKLNFFVSHGKNDDVIPIDVARKTPLYLQEKNVKHIYNEYVMGHTINDKCLQDLIDWVKH